ncbi:FecCD family ABC transporter permease [Natronogracilivirga saccharolytica]|uniref:Iron ABC transporter permease n=1 Tax=Natronogracilivirga saccharolytica TaxID=2812953 RepID=A0A8J7RJ81_9BACT|nr:iron ABC transporter permease [Natronogracilivirga saccharolytica]MBP3191760.1 iron ABC transporter permease [Natronogracilivirga saccharolytica]
MNQVIRQYHHHIRKRLLFLALIFLATLLVAVYAMSSGAAGLSWRDVILAVTGRGDTVTEQIVIHIRLPRVLAALLGGLALSVSGAVMQSLLRNPLASPYTLGISGAAAFGAAFGIVFLGSGHIAGGDGEAAIRLFSVFQDRYAVMGSAFIWSLAGTGLILAIARFRGITPEILILAGIAIGSLFSAGLSALQYIATDIELAAIVFWMFGDLGRAGWTDIGMLALILTPIMVFFMFMTWNYKALQSGDEYARSVGVNPDRIRLSGMLAASLATAVVVSYYGIIAFVGLVVPHIVRRIIGGDESFLIPATAVFGGMFLLLSDTVARTLFSPVILPVGILTSFIGAPLFLFLLIRGVGRGYWT